jgi:hypothetical protein
MTYCYLLTTVDKVKVFLFHEDAQQYIICQKNMTGICVDNEEYTIHADGVLSAQLPRRPPPRSRMYTGASVLATQPGRRCLPL